MHHEMLLTLNDMQAERAVQRGIGFRQGGADTPDMFNWTMWTRCEDLVEAWSGVPNLEWAPEHRHGAILNFADNFWLISSSLSQLHERAMELDDALFHAGFPIGSAEFLVGAWGASDAPEQLLLPSGAVMLRKEKIEALGVLLDPAASTETMVEHRMTKSDKLWHQHGAELLSDALPFASRLDKAYSTLGQSTLHGCQLWVPSTRLRLRLCGRENRWLRQLGCQSRPDDVPWLLWWRQEHARLQEERVLAGQFCLLQSFLGLFLSWWGHAARGSAGLAATEALQWRNLPWWRCEQCNPFGARHPSTGWRESHEIMLEAWTAEWFSRNWLIDASDHTWWRAMRSSWLSWANEKLGGPQMPLEIDRGTWRRMRRQVCPWRMEEEESARSDEDEQGSAAGSNSDDGQWCSASSASESCSC